MTDRSHKDIRSSGRFDPTLPVGVPVRAATWKTTAAGNQLTVGWWTLEGLAGMVPTDVPCPYCKEPLRAVLAKTIARIVRVNARHEFTSDGLIQVLPAGYQALGCLSCTQLFTVPVDVPQPEA